MICFKICKQNLNIPIEFRDARILIFNDYRITRGGFMKHIAHNTTKNYGRNQYHSPLIHNNQEIAWETIRAYVITTITEK